MSKCKPTKATIIVVLAILLALTVGTVAFFADRVTHQMQFTTATFTDNGYTITREAPNGPYAAGETITVPITETNTGSEAIKSSIKMTATWSSPDTATARQLFNSAVTLKIGDTTLNYEVSQDKKSITFTLPDQVLGTTAGTKTVTRDLTLTVPEAFVSTGNVTFTFDKATVSQNPVGFSTDYNSSKLAALKCSTQVVWAASTMSNSISTPNGNKALYGYLNETCDGIIYEMGFGYSRSAMKDFANTSASKWSNYKSVIKTLSFPEGMTTVGDYAFDGFTKVTSVSFPSTTEGIGQYAFNASGLTGTLTIPATVNTIEDRAFGLLPNVTTITFNHTDSDVLTLPANRTANSTNGAFYVEDHVDTVVNSDVVEIQYEYGWHDGWDNRRLIPTLAAQNTWKYTDPSTYDTPIDTSALQTVRFADYYIPDGTETKWDGSDTPVPGTVTVYLSADGKTVTIAGNGYGKIYANQYSDYAFQYLSGVTSYDNIEILDTSKAEDMSYMFGDNYSVTDLEVGHFDTSNVEYMSGMFYICYNLPKLDVSNWDTGKVLNTAYMFSDCNSLTSLAGIQNWDTQNVTNMRSMFDGVESLTSLDLSTKKVTMNGRTYDSWDTGSVTNMNSMFGNTDGDPHLLKELNISTFDTRNVTNMKLMFQRCTSLETLNVTPTKISLNGGEAFYTWDTGKVTTMYGMFTDCSSLKSLDLSGWDTSSVASASAQIKEDFYQMFMGCSSLETLNVSRKAMSNINGRSYTSWDTSKAICMESMFDGCTSLKSLNLKDWTNTAAQNMDFMFYDCEAMSSIDLTNFTTPALTSASSMFDGCASLETIDVSSFDTSKVKDFTYMFNDCTSLETLDVSNFSTESLVYGHKIKCFAYNCPNLTTIVLGENFGHADKLPVAGSSAGMFYVSSFVDTTITGANDVMKAYDWVADKRMLVPTKIEITTQPTKTTYTDGDNFDKSGMKVTATFNDGSTRDVTSECVIEDGDNLPEGKTTVTVSYTLNGVTVKATVNITVEPATIKITYNANGGAFPDGSTTNEVVFMADSYAVVSGNYEAPTLTDKGLVGWYTDSLCTDGKEFDLSKATGDTTVYAKWAFYPTILPGNTWSGITGNVEKRTITSISIVDSYTPSSSDTFLKNADVGNTGEIKVYKNGTKLIIAGNGSGKIYANANSMDMFSHYEAATSITGLDLLDTSRVTDMSWMFYHVMSVTSLDLSSWDTSSVTNMTAMFGDAWSDTECLLTTIYVSDLWSVEAVTTSNNMFGSDICGCTHLVGGNGTVYNESYQDSTYARVDKPGQPGYLTYKNPLPSNTLIINYNANNTFFANSSTTNTVYYSGEFNPATQTRDVIAGEYAEPTTYGEEFYGWYTNAACTDGYEFDLSKATESVTVYAKVSSPKYPVLAPADTWCKTSYSALEITSLSIVNNYTPSSYDEVWNADIGNTGAIKVYRVGSDLIMTSNGASKIYANANSSEAFAFSDGTGYPTPPRKAFSSITGLDLLDTSAITNASKMFFSQVRLTSLDLSSWDTSNMQTAFGMFWGCQSLKTIYVSQSWDASDTLDITTEMFTECTSLVGGNGTTFNSSYTDSTYARIDAAGSPGYFTYKAAPAAAASVMSFSANGNSLESINIQ